LLIFALDIQALVAWSGIMFVLMAMVREVDNLYFCHNKNI
jgi:hypothetical protein